jgi:hypothetical protein
MKSKMLLFGTALMAASVAVAAPVQAHDRYNDLWPLYGLTGLILLDSYSDHHHHHKRHYYGGPRYRHEYRRDYSYGHPTKHRHRYDDRGRGRHR